jgi:hypothetical protein
MSWFHRHEQDKQARLPARRQGLSTHQRRALNSTLVHLERQLLNLERLVRGSEQGILIRHTGQISLSNHEYLMNLFDQLREEIRITATEYALPGAEEDVRATLMGTSSILWCDLEEIRPAALNRYGAVDPALEETLGPHIERLIQGVLAIEALAKSERTTSKEEEA